MEFSLHLDENLSEAQAAEVAKSIFSSIPHLDKSLYETGYEKVGRLNIFRFHVPSEEIHNRIRNPSHPLYYESMVNHPSTIKIIPTPPSNIVTKGSIEIDNANDPLLKNQWHLCAINWEKDGYVSEAGSAQIAIVDDGYQHSHPDLKPGYVSADSYDFIDNDSDPNPPQSSSHGTGCAGVAGAAINDGTCGVGVAPKARMSGIRLVGGSANMADEANAISYHPANNHIYSNSWGPPDTGAFQPSITHFDNYIESSLLQNVKTGRGGLGSIYTWAAGNGRHRNDNSNRDLYANSIYTIAVGAVNSEYQYSFYSEPGSNLLVCAPSNGGTLGITTADLLGRYGATANECRDNFGGTSAATPVVSGVISQMLSAKSQLSWRDVMWILALSSRKVDSSDSLWRANQGGNCVNENYGHGLVDSRNAISLAKKWTTVGTGVGPSFNKTASASSVVGDNSPVTSTINITPSEVSSIAVIEQIEVLVQFSHPRAQSLTFRLTSPSNSYSILIGPNDLSNSATTISSWRLTTTMHWGETDIDGNWILTVTDESSDAQTGTLTGWEITFHGASSVPSKSFSNSCGNFVNKLEECDFLNDSSLSFASLVVVTLLISIFF